MIVCPSCSQENPAGARFCSACGAALEASPAQAREERKVVTVLFADLVGFTARSEQLDPEDVRAGRNGGVRVALALLAGILVVAGCGRASDDTAGVPDPDDPGVLLFSGIDDTPSGYYAMRPDGTGLRRLAFAEEESLSYSPDGRFAATAATSYAQDKSGLPTEMTTVFVSRADGSDRRRVPLPEGRALSPSVSSGGNRLAFVFAQDEAPWDVWTVSVNGEGLERLTSTGEAEDPAWSPDGERLVFWDGGSYHSDESGDIYVVRADGTGLRHVARGLDPAWSPDGKRIAFADPEWHITVFDLSGEKPEVVNENARQPVWSPDGKRLAFLRVTKCGHATCKQGIFVADARGGSARRVGPTLGEATLLSWITADVPDHRRSPANRPAL